MLTLWGRTSSINVRKVMLAARLLELPFERIDAGASFGIVKTPEYLAHNPNAMVPMIEDDGFWLWESNVIVRYLCTKHGRLMPQDLRARFGIEQWMDWQQTTLNPAGRNAFLQWIRTPAERRDPKVIAASVAETEPLLDMLEAQLAKTAFICGDALTAADIPVACEMHRWYGLPVDHPQRPHLRLWYDGICSLPAARGVLDLPLS